MAFFDKPVIFTGKADKDNYSIRLVRFYLQGKDCTYYFLDRGIITKSSTPPALKISSTVTSRLEFVRPCTDVKVDGCLSTKSDLGFLPGNVTIRQPSDAWGFSALLYSGVWKNTDLFIAHAQDGLRFEWRLKSSADHTAIRLRRRGAGLLTIDLDGNLRAEYLGCIMTDNAPIAWQDSDDGRKYIECNYKLLPDNTYGFDLPRAFNPRLPLTITA